MRGPGESGAGFPSLPVGTPSPEWLHLLALLFSVPAGDSLELLRELCVEHPWLKAACTELQQVPLEHWQAEHTRLFVTGYPRTACPPFASAYQGLGAPGAILEKLAGFYREQGLAVDEVPLDFLGTLFECWAYLLGQGRMAEAETLWRTHLSGWLPRFNNDLRQHAELILYRLLGEQLDALVSSQSPGDA